MDSGGNLSFCWFHGNFIDNKKKILLYTIHYFTCMVQCFTCFKLHGLFLIENQNAYFFKINKGFEITSSLHKMLWPWLFINIHYLFIIYLSLYFSFIKSTRFLAIHCLILAWLISDQYMYNLFIPSPLSCLKFIYFTHYRSSLIKIYSLITFLCIVYFNISKR